MSAQTADRELSHPYFMGLALAKARAAAGRGDVPVGAVLVSEGEVYSGEGNAREQVADPTAHAEIQALRAAAERMGGWRLNNATLYVTVEPCLLCTGAIYLARIPRVVFGCTNPKGGALLYLAARERDMNLNHSPEIVAGVREEECASLLREFFDKRRDGRVVEGA